jgi:hypothetical protein
MSIITPMLSDAIVTMPESFYGPLFLQSAFAGACILLVLAYYEPAFRSWLAWLVILVLWAGGTTALFMAYRAEIVSQAAYPWVAPVVRMLGFIVIGYQFRHAVPRRA